ncbi:MAG: GntR family transcriptional regulator, partial [Streptococcaceae bacterium]|nr:GntR family transcriptional regulator [Streptococcaceae bacterium]
SEYDLAAELQVSRLTIRKAIDELIKNKILVKRKSKGTYVISRQKIQSGRGGLQSFSEAAKFLGKTSITQVVSFEKLQEVPAEVALALEVDHLLSPTIYKLVRIRSLDADKMTVEKVYIPEQYVKNVSQEELQNSLFAIIEQQTEIGYSHQEIEAALITSEISELLDIPLGQAVLRAQSTTFSIDAKPILHDISYYRSDKYSFKNTLVRGQS